MRVLNFLWVPLGFPGVPKILSKSKDTLFVFLSLKLGTCIYENGQCLGVAGYPENVVRVLIFLGVP